MYPKHHKDDQGNEVVTVSKKDYDELQEQFDNGFKKGRVHGRKDAVSLFDFLDADVDAFVKEGNADTLRAAIKDATQVLKDLKEGKLPKEVISKIEDKEGVISELQTKLDEKSRALTEAEQKHTDYRRSTIIDSALGALAGSKKAIDSADVIASFQRSYRVELDDKDRVVVRTADGNPITDGRGNDLGLESVFSRFAEEKKHLFEGAKNSGSGGGPGGDPGNSKVLSMTDEQFAKTAEAVRSGQTVNVE